MNNEIVLKKVNMKIEEPPFDKRVLLFLNKINTYQTRDDSYTPTVVTGYKHSITSDGPQFMYEANGDYTKPTHWVELPLNE